MFLTEYNEKEHLKNTRQEGYDDGVMSERKINNKLTQLLIFDNRIDDLSRSTTDDEYRNKLLAEYNLK